MTRGQIEFEWEHLRRKLDARASDWRDAELTAGMVLPHPLFRAVARGVAHWERTAYRRDTAARVHALNLLRRPDVRCRAA